MARSLNSKFINYYFNDQLQHEMVTDTAAAIYLGRMWANRLEYSQWWSFYSLWWLA